MLEERDAARADSRLKARFLSYRLNQPSADESAVLLTTARAEMLILTLCCARSPVKAPLDLMPGASWATVVSPLSASRATLALNVGLRFLRFF